jgi:predicted AlkP superfamily phosphohydrolase/phosphomutase
MSAPASATSPSTKVLLVGWDAADWRVIRPLLAEGKMPVLQQLLSRGVSGNLATLEPPYSPMLWTSIATGKRPQKHGIHGFAEPDPENGGVRPITNLSRKTKALWNILAQNGKRSLVVGWWPSHPAEPIPGVMVSNRFQRAPHSDPAQPWPLIPGTIHPAGLAAELAELRVHPAELGAADLLPFIPRAAEIDQEKDVRLRNFARILADISGIQAAATHLLATQEWDFAGIYFDGIDHFGHGFMRYHPPRREGVDERDFELYRHVVEGAYRFHDMMLGGLLAHVPPHTHVVLMSDHGFHPDHLRPLHIPADPAGPAIEHRAYGILALAGPGLRENDRVTGATLLDICPTLLRLFDLPFGEDMDGRPLLDVWKNPPPLAAIASWDEVDGPRDAGLHPPDLRLDPEEARESLRQLQELGYIAPLPAEREKAVAQTVRELRFNLAQSHLDAGELRPALALLRQLDADWPDEFRFAQTLVSALLRAGRVAEARARFERLAADREARRAGAQAELQAALAETPSRPNSEAGRQAFRRLPAERQRELRKLFGLARGGRPALVLLEAALLAAERKPADALALLDTVAEGGDPRPEYHLRRAGLLVALRRPDEADAAYLRALALDADCAAAHVGRARLHLAAKRPFDAAGSALEAIGLLYHQPEAHFLLGLSLRRLRKPDDALRALEVCLAQNPLHARARAAVIRLAAARRDLARTDHHRRIRDEIRARLAAARKSAAEAARAAAEAARAAGTARPEPAAPTPAPPPSAPGAEAARSAIRAVAAAPFDYSALPPPRPDAPFVTVVGGLPRSGTSMMMQMLVAGGLPALTDGLRTPDADNPRGYLEFHPALRLREDASFLPHARGRALKLVAQLLPHLPAAGHDYRVILMERDLDEVLASQRAMLERHALEGGRITPERLRRVFAQQLQAADRWLAARGVPVLRVAQRECLRDPAAVAARLRDFLGLPLDLEAMRAAVDPTLHRQRRAG